MLQSYKYITHKNKKIEDILKSFFLLHPNNIDLSLERIKKLLKKLNNPHKKIKNIIHIAGTNGKGSIATILYYLQKNQGKAVNIYRSPHLVSFNERIHIRNKQVSNQYLLDILEYVKEINDKQPITFFEIITAATFYMFYQNLADLTILEVGLGGQFDATNVIENNLVSIISTIGIDHKEFLGSTIKAIANEKVEIIKKKIEEIQNQFKENINLSDDVINYIASECKTNIRELIGVLNRVIAFSRVHNKSLDIGDCKKILRDVFSQIKVITVDKIQNTVSNFFNIALSEMLSQRRSRPLARPRQIAMFLAKKMTTRSLPEIGRRFANRDHTTVIHAVKTITRLSEQDDEMKKNISQIKSLLLEN